MNIYEIGCRIIFKKSGEMAYYNGERHGIHFAVRSKILIGQKHEGGQPVAHTHFFSLDDIEPLPLKEEA